jgi:hypothetical protein
LLLSINAHKYGSPLLQKDVSVSLQPRRAAVALLTFPGFLVVLHSIASHQESFFSCCTIIQYNNFCSGVKAETAEVKQSEKIKEGNNCMVYVL